jgi:hypothetical protein
MSDSGGIRLVMFFFSMIEAWKELGQAESDGLPDMPLTIPLREMTGILE